MKKYEFYTRDIITKGDLKGYINGHITFYYNNDEFNHEFLYRFDDEENGENFKLVSIDYGYKIPFINEAWKDIETDLYNYINKYINPKIKERSLLVTKNLRLIKALKDSKLCSVYLSTKQIIITCNNDIDIMKQLQKVCNNVKGFEQYKIAFANPINYGDYITV